jgi:hypothetical protein
MAGDWIKMRSNLWDDPRVAAVCDACGCGEAQAVGAMYWLWATADQHSEDGLLPGMTARQINRKTGVQGFAEALQAAGWLILSEEGAQIVRFDEHNGTSAKRRASESRRKMSARDADKQRTESGCGAEGERTDPGQPAHLEEEREKREEQEPSSLRSDSSSAGAEDAKRAKQEAKKQRLKQVTQEAIDAYNARMAKPRGLLPGVRLLTDERMRQVKRCLPTAVQIAQSTTGATVITPEFWADYFEAVSADPFWSGQTPPGRGHESWTPNFDSLTQPDVMAKIYERTEQDAPLEGAA